MPFFGILIGFIGTNLFKLNYITILSMTQIDGRKSSRRSKLKLASFKSKTGQLSLKSHAQHPLFNQELTLGQSASDIIAKFVGSWTFILTFLCLLCFWVFLNSYLLLNKPFDPYPYILLNLVLSMVAALQAPVILMSQNRQAERDRIDAKYDHQVNRKAEREIQEVQRQLKDLRHILRKSMKFKR